MHITDYYYVATADGDTRQGQVGAITSIGWIWLDEGVGYSVFRVRYLDGETQSMPTCNGAFDLLTAEQACNRLFGKV